MGEARRKFDRDFREGAVRLVRETGKPIAQVARDLGVNEGTLGNWVNADRRRRDGGSGELAEDERAELARLRKENAELAMRCDVLKRSVASGSKTRCAIVCAHICRFGGKVGAAPRRPHARWIPHQLSAVVHAPAVQCSLSAAGSRVETRSEGATGR